MSLPIIADKSFKAVNELRKAEYEACTFTDCILTSANMDGSKFRECLFSGCDLSNATVGNTGFTDTVFSGCKLIGLKFEDCDDFLFTPTFKDCNLNFVSMFAKSFKNATISNCTFHDADFTDCILTGAIFSNCDFLGAGFSNTNLEKADFSESFNITLDPERNKLAAAKFSLNSLPGLLTKHKIVIK